MKKDRQEIRSWSDMYLDTLEEIYGPFNLHPALSVEDLCKEWSDNFGLKQTQVRVEEHQAERVWSESYMASLELLFGEINMHPTLSIEELCEEWKDLFRADGRVQREKSTRLDYKQWSDSYLEVWPLQTAS